MSRSAWSERRIQTSRRSTMRRWSGSSTASRRGNTTACWPRKMASANSASAPASGGSASITVTSAKWCAGCFAANAMLDSGNSTMTQSCCARRRTVSTSGLDVWSSVTAIPCAAIRLRSTAIFRELSNDQLAEIWSRAKVHNLQRGATLVRQGAASDSVYVVVSGRFEVWIEGHQDAISEIGVGEPIGEVGFFAGTPRTATIIAARDSAVLELDRPSFDAVARQVPAIHQTLLRTLARRLAEGNRRLASEPRAAPARTVAVIAGGREPIPQAFFERLDSVVG